MRRLAIVVGALAAVLVWATWQWNSSIARKIPALEPEASAEGKKGGRKSKNRSIDWPYYRHDLQLTGRSPGKGNIDRAPREKWKLYIGGWDGLISVRHRARANQELRFTEGKFFGQDYRAKAANRWDPPVLVDLAGDGKLVAPPPGKIAKLLPDVKGLQQVVWEPVAGVPNSGRGRCYSFAEGANRPKLVWETKPEKEVYEMLWAIADMDGDGKPEVAFMTHYRIIVYDGQTGKKKSTLRWPIGRNYGQFTLADLGGDGRAAAVVVAGPPHADALRYAPGEGKLLWSKRYITDAQVSLPIELKLHPVPACVQDLDGDGKIEVVYNLYNHENDRKWHTIILDARTGAVKHNLAGVYLWGVADLGRKTKSLCCLTAPGAGYPEEGEGLLLDFKAGRWQQSWQAKQIRWQMMPYRWPAHEYSIWSSGPTTNSVPRVLDVDGDGRNEVFVCRGGRTVEALGLGPSGKVEVKWSVSGPQGSRLTVEGGSAAHREVLVNVDSPGGQVRLTHCKGAAQGHYQRQNLTPLPAMPLPMVADIDGDGTNEVIVQDTRWTTRVLRYDPKGGKLRTILTVPGGGLWLGRIWETWPPSKFPVFTADLDGDGKRELLLTDVGSEVVATVTCLDASGRKRWRCPLPQTAARGIVWMAAAHFRNRKSQDLLVVVQPAPNACEGFCLDGATGKVLWQVPRLKLKDGTPFCFGATPGVADVDGDGLDDIIGESMQYLFAVRGKDGKSLAMPRNMIGDLFPHFVTYGVGVLGDWDSSGRVSLFTNTTLNGFGLVTGKLERKWFTDRNGQPTTRLGAIGRVEKDGGWAFGTFMGNTFQTYDMKTGKLLVSEELKGIAPDPSAEVYCADIDGDGRDEFLTRAGDRLICVRGDRGKGPRLKWSVRLPVVASQLTIADADNDGFLDILYTGSDGYVHCLGR